MRPGRPGFRSSMYPYAALRRPTYRENSHAHLSTSTDAMMRVPWMHALPWQTVGSILMRVLQSMRARIRARVGKVKGAGDADIHTQIAPGRESGQ
jgi:hypothetical protein